MKFPYEDIINRPRPVSPRHAPMPDADRAAQFAPFAALTGHEEAIRETARLTDTKAELDEDEKALLNETLLNIARNLSSRPQVSIVCFFRDQRKEGGAYVTVTGVVKKIDTAQQMIVMENGEHLALGDVYAIQCPCTLAQ